MQSTRKSSSRLRIAVAGFFLLPFLLCLIVDQWIQIHYDYSENKKGSISEISETDVVIIPGASVHGKKLSKILESRLQTGLKLYKKKKVKKILLSGDNGKSDYNELKPMLQFVLENGVSENDVFVDYAGFRTLDTLWRAKEVFKIQKAVFISQEFHLPRTLFIAQNLQMDLQVLKSDSEVLNSSFYYRLREFFARNKAFIDLYILNTKPKFLGQAFPITESGKKTWKGILL